MIPYMVGKLALSSSHLTRGLVKYVPGKGYFRTVPSQNGDKYVTSPPPPPIVQLVVCTKPVTPRTHDISALSLQTPHVLPSPPCFIPRKSMDPKTTTPLNEGSPQDHLRSWGTLIPFSLHSSSPRLSTGGGGWGASGVPPLSASERSTSPGE